MCISYNDRDDALAPGDLVVTAHGWKGVLIEEKTHQFYDASSDEFGDRGIDTVQWIVAPERYVGTLDQIHRSMLSRADSLV